MKKFVLFICLFIFLTIPMESYAFSNNNWMSQIDGNKSLSQLSIPGTHDSGAMYEPVSGTAKCQDLTLDEQLNTGVRYLDVRCRICNDSFTIHHGSIYQHLNFDDVINTCTNFLRNNPTETIIMSVKEEYTGSGNTKTFEEIFNSYTAKNQNIWLLTDKIPTLKDARGKIVLLRRFSSKKITLGINASPWKDNEAFTISNSAKLNIQDYYKVGSNDNKWTAIADFYNLAKNSNDNSLYINYTSGYKSMLGIPSITWVSNSINPKLIDYFTKNTKGHFGISAVDFIDKEISTRIILTNF